VTYFHEFPIHESTTFLISKEKFYLVLKEKKKNLREKNRGFVDSEFVKTCHEHVDSVFVRAIGLLKEFVIHETCDGSSSATKELSLKSLGRLSFY
jgi:hypothetical protein